MAPDTEVAVETADTVTAFMPEEWDVLLQPTDYFRHGYMSALEGSDLDCRFHYVALRARGKLVGLGFGCLTRFDFRRWRPKIWLAGSPVNLGTPFAFATGHDTPEARHLLQTALFERARCVGALYFLLRDLPAPSLEKASAMTAPSLRLLPMPLHHTAILPLNFSSFEAWLMTLKGSRRKSARRDIRAVDDAGLSLSTEPPSSRLVPRLLELWLPLYRKHHDPDQIRLTEGYFRALMMRPESVFLLLWQGETLVAFDLCLRSGSLLSSIFSGIDPTLTGDLPIHRYMGYAIVRRALALGCTAIDFGISNEETKVRMGCRLEMLYGYGRPVSPVLHRLGIGRLVRALFAAPEIRLNKLSLDTAGKQTLPEAPAISQGRRRVIVIGAGLSGLAVAARLSAEPRLEIVVLERTSEIGGLCRTMAFGDGPRGFVGGCNLFSPRFFSLLSRAYEINLPVRRARTLIYYDGVPLDPRTLTGRLTTPNNAAALWRITSAAVNGERLMADAVRQASTRASLVTDFALLPFLLQGQDPRRWPVRAGIAKLLRANSCFYPTPGLASVPQSLKRVIERYPTARIELETTALKVVTQDGKAVGVHTQRGELPAEIVVGSLPPEIMRQLLRHGRTHAVQRPEGLSAMAVFLQLDSAFPLPVGYYSLTFLAPNVQGQLDDLFSGRLPAQRSFDLVCPDLVEGQPPPEGWRITLFATCPAGEESTVIAEEYWRHIGEHLERIFPGFTAAIRWCKPVAPDDYVRVVGCASRLSPYADAPPRDEVPWPIDGLYLSHGVAGLAAGDTWAALWGGLSCATSILERLHSSTENIERR